MTKDTESNGKTSESTTQISLEERLTRSLDAATKARSDRRIAKGKPAEYGGFVSFGYEFRDFGIEVKVVASHYAGKARETLKEKVPEWKQASIEIASNLQERIVNNYQKARKTTKHGTTKSAVSTPVESQFQTEFDVLNYGFGLEKILGNIPSEAKLRQSGHGSFAIAIKNQFGGMAKYRVAQRSHSFNKMLGSKETLLNYAFSIEQSTETVFPSEKTLKASDKRKETANTQIANAIKRQFNGYNNFRAELEVYTANRLETEAEAAKTLGDKARELVSGRKTELSKGLSNFGTELVFGLYRLYLNVTNARAVINAAKFASKEDKYLSQIKEADGRLRVIYTTLLSAAGKTSPYTGLDEEDLIMPSHIIDVEDRVNYRKTQLNGILHRLQTIDNMFSPQNI